MFYCPMCKAEVEADALYCRNCGYNSTSARMTTAAPPLAPPSTSKPTQPVKPALQQKPTQFASLTQPNGPNQTRDENGSQAVTPRANSAPLMHKQSTRLIRPIEIQPSKQPNTPSPLSSNIDFPALPQSTPAHLLALSPITPPGISALHSSSPSSSPEQPGEQQLMQSAFMASPQQEPGMPSALPRARGAQVPQNTPFPTQPVQQQTTPTTPLSWQGQSAGPRSEQAMPSQTPLGAQLPQMQAPIRPDVSHDVVKGHPQLSLTLDDFEGYDEGYAATSLAAERWRTSWRKRQHTEAGPAIDVSRGQSSVPEPLMIMQHSFARLRAIVAPQRQRRTQQAKRGFWITTGLMLCLIVGLLGYITWTYLPTPDATQPIAAPLTTSVEAAQPSLSMQGMQMTSIEQGQMLHLHGDNFNIGAPIIFLLDGLTAINGTNGRELAIETSNQGSFTVDIPTKTWSPGEHTIQAQDNASGQLAYLNVQVNLTSSATVSADLGLSVSAKLTFSKMLGASDPPEQFVKLTNKNPREALQWYATAEVDNNLSWLVVDPTTTGGKLRIGGTGTIGISVTTESLKSSTTPYTGKIIFTINHMEQLTLPVELEVRNTTDELIVSPNPLLSIPGSDGSCQAQSLLLINIGPTQMSWNMHMDNVTKQHIQLQSNGKPVSAGLLAATGETGDMQVLTLTCTHVHNGDTYSFTISGNNVSWPESVAIVANP